MKVTFKIMKEANSWYYNQQFKWVS